MIIQFHGVWNVKGGVWGKEFNGVAGSEGIFNDLPTSEISTGSVWNTLHSDEGNGKADDFWVH
ncbi:MAG: hypothetical protein CM15mP49_25570 [Actinomycetota bacterium]|nr:MAG: hypothetical protein CM15mP49_25570 [Actinomycetota bacterium]